MIESALTYYQSHSAWGLPPPSIKIVFFDFGRWFIPLFQEIEGVEQFGEIVDNIGKILKLPEENINGIKLAAGGKGAKRDTLAFECAMKDNGTGMPD